MNLDLDNIDTLDIIEVIPYYDKFDMLGIIDEDKDNVKSREYFIKLFFIVGRKYYVM